MNNFPFSSLALPDFGNDPPANLALARGYVSEIAEIDGALTVEGWLMLPERELDSAVLYVNGMRADATLLQPREGLRKQFPWIPHVTQAGFRLRQTNGNGGIARAGRIDILGLQNDQPLARLGTLFRLDDDPTIPLPPDDLRERVTASRDARFFRVDGMKCCGEFLQAAAPFCDWQSVRRVLDWGCGCGRVTRHLLDFLPDAEICGCDIDAEAIAWCRANLPRGQFTATPPYPPLPYPDNHFDLIVSYSVFTHLTREAQTAWLAEIERVLAPGGLFGASTHGPFAASFAFPDSYQERLADGIDDDLLDARLDGIAPEGYYRLVYQTPDYTTREFSEYFDMLAYHERGIGNFQDLVVMRQSDEKRKHRQPQSAGEPGAVALQSPRELTARLQSLQARYARLEKSYHELHKAHTGLGKSYLELEQWAHELERTVKEQQGRLEQYDRFPVLRRLASRFNRPPQPK